MECLIYSSVSAIGLPQAAVRCTVETVFQKEKQQGNISVHFIGDTRMTSLNRVYRGKNKTTDVLSFAATEDVSGVDFPDPEKEWGDIFISVPQIKRQAKQFGVSYKQELTRMLVHGVLHIFGYDHMVPADATIMFAKQEKYVTLCLSKK